MSPCVGPLSLCSEEQPADDPHLTVSLPLSTFVNSHVRSLQQLTSRVSTLTVSLPWVITSHLPLILCRIEVSSDQQPILEVSLTIDATLQWTATVLHKRQELGVVRSELQQSEDVLFHWSLIAATWDDEVAAKLMTMIVELWVTVRGFSLASAWIERYKGATKKTLQKAKPLRKQI